MTRSLRLGLISSQAFSIPNFRGPLVREWVARGHRVFAFAPDYDAATRSAVAALGAEPVDYTMQRASISPLADLSGLLGLARLLRRVRLDVSFSYFIKPVIYGSLAARLAGVERRFAMVEGAGYVYSDGDGRTGWKRRWLRRAVTGLYRLGLGSVHGVFFLNRDDLDLFVGSRMVAPARAILAGGIGVDLDQFAPAAPVTSTPTFLLAARLLAEKGVRDYVEAARHVRATRPGTRFILLGDTDANPSSVRKQELRDWADEGVIEWPGHVGDVRPWLAEASVFVLPSYYREGVPRSIQEAMAMARPIITTDMPGCRDTVDAGGNGWLVPPRDPAALAEAMMRFVDQPELIARMGVESRRLAEARFDVRRTNALILGAMGLQ